MPLSNNPLESAFDFSPKTPPVTQDDLQVAQTQTDKPTFGETFRAAAENDGTIPAVISRYQGAQFVPQPDYRPSEEDWKGLTKDLPVEEHHKLLQATSPAHAEFLKEHLMEEQRLSTIQSEGSGMANLAAGMTDPGMLAAGVLTAPLAVSSKASVIMNAIKSGAVTGATNVGLDATLKSLQDRKYDFKDAAYDFFIGSAIGAPLGALATPAEQAASHTIAANAARGLVKDELKDLNLSHPSSEVNPLASGGAAATDMKQVPLGVDPEFGTDATVMNTPKSAMTHLKMNLPIVGEVKIPLRFDMRGRLGAADNDSARYLGSLLGGESVGLEGHAAVRDSAAEWAMLHTLDYGDKVGRTWKEAYGQWVRENPFSNMDAISGKRAVEFDLHVGKAIRGETEGLSAHAINTAKVISEQQTRLLRQAQKYGVEGFEDVAENPYYAMRMFNHKKIEELNEKFGTGNLQNLISNSIRKVRPEWDAEQAAKTAKGYLRAVRVVGRDKKLPGAGTFAAKDKNYLTELLHNEGLDKETTDDIIGLMSQEKPDPGIARSKPRLPLDEIHSEPLKSNLTGEYENVSVSDLFEQRGSVLFNTYLRQMSGQIGLAQVGIKSEGQFKKMLTDILNDGRGDTATYTRYAQGMYDNIIGRPMFTDDFGKLTQIAGAISDLNFMRIGNQFGFAQIAEMGHVMSPTYIRAFMNGMSSYRDLVGMARGGKMTSKIATDIEEIIGFGGEFNLNRPSSRSEEDIADGISESALGYQFDRGKQVTSTISGLRSVNAMEKGVTARIVIQRISDWALQESISPAHLKQLGFMSLEGETLARVMADTKKYLEYSDSKLVPNAKVKGINYEKWQKEAPDTYEKFRFSVFRETNRIILDPDVGKTAYLMHHPLMKPLMQFRRFMLISYSSHLLHGMHNVSWDTACAYSAAMFLGGMAYVAQSGVNYLGDPEGMEKALTPEAIAKAAFNRAAFSSILPMATDSALGMLGYDPQFSGSRNSTLPSGALVGNPSVDFANKLWNTATTAAGAMNGTREWTQSDVKSAYQLLPFSNAVGVRNLGNILSKQFPKTDPNESYSSR